MKRNKGFTLVEMLIVIAAISVLVAIAIPNFRNSRIKAGVKADTQTVSALFAEVKAAYDIKGEKNYEPKDGWPVMEQDFSGDTSQFSDLIIPEKGWEKGQTVKIKVEVDENDPEKVQFEASFS